MIVWHVSNEYNGESCYCPLCLEAFQEWLRRRYDNDLDALNGAWCATFWSHRYSDWSEIQPVDSSIHGLMLDWKRFLTEQTIDFFQTEIGPPRCARATNTTSSFSSASTGNRWFADSFSGEAVADTLEEEPYSTRILIPLSFER